MVPEKMGTNKSETTTCLRTALSFAILRATNICIRSSRGLKRVIPTEDIDYTVVNNETMKPVLKGLILKGLNCDWEVLFSCNRHF